MVLPRRFSTDRRSVTSSLTVAAGVGFCSVAVLVAVSPVSTLAFAVVPPTLTTKQGIIAQSTSRLYMGKDKYNPIGSLIGDMASSLMGGVTPSASSNPQTDTALKSVSSSSSWTDVRSTLEKLQTPEERAFRDNIPKGYGKGSPLHALRLFDESNKEEDVRVTLYRDSASWCPYCQKVWTMLEEKKIPYRVEKVNMRCYGEKPASFMRVQPSGNIPVAVIDGRVYGQSNDIMYALEQLFPEHKSLSAPKGQEMKAQQLLRLERQIFSAWMYWLTSNGDSQRLRQNFEMVLQDVENALEESGGPFFMGKTITIVDLMFAPFLERMAASLLFFKGYMMRVPKGTKSQCPNLNKWFDAMETLDSYQLTKSDYYTHCWDLPPQLGGCTYEEGGEPYENAINGLRSLDGKQGSWELPLRDGFVSSGEPDWDWAGDENAARREAVERLSYNHEAIVKFAARGAGRKGMPPYMAALADPNAVPNEAVQTGIDLILRVVCMALLEGTDNHDTTMDKLAVTVVKEGGSDYTDGIIASLSYLRERVGVPRDMKLHAARQLRAHLNWAISKVLTAQES